MRFLGPLAVVELLLGVTLTATGRVAVIFGQQVPEPYGYLLTYGPLGVFAVLMVLGRVVSRAELDRANARADRAETQRDELAQRMVSDLVPLVAEVQRTMVPALQQVAEGQKAIMTSLTELQGAVVRLIESRR